MNTQTVSMTDFDLDKLRLTQNYGEAAPVQRVFTNLPVRKPLKEEFYRVRPGGDWCIPVMTVEIKQEGEIYLLYPEVWHVLPDIERPVTMYLASDRRGNPFLIPVPLPGPDGKLNLWHQSLAEAVKLAQKSWVRSSANRAAGCYDVFEAKVTLPEPLWPEVPLADLIEIAFRGRIIKSADHPVIQQFLGLS